ncbi:MAG TPA: hypothetical protein VFZ24_17250 [Longimicrobiales bacterium]
MREKHLAYCDALERVVHVYVRPVSDDETDPDTPQTPGIMCIEHAEECLGVECPLFELPMDAAMLRMEWFLRRH